jgi:hypothetical protein
MLYVYRITPHVVDNIDDLNVHTWAGIARNLFAKERRPRLVGVRNFEWDHVDDDGWMKPSQFGHGKGCVKRIHDAYRRGFIQFRVRLRKRKEV